MRIPVIRGLIDRRILVNYRVEARAIQRYLPPPFRPALVNGWAIGGICLIRLRKIRPRFVPAFVGLASENSAHRIAVEWAGDDGFRKGVYIPRRDTSSRLNSLVGGRVFPGVHHHAAFTVQEEKDSYSVHLESDDRSTRLLVEARVADTLPSDSVFKSLEEASSFFEGGSLGFSPNPDCSCFDGLELRAFSWSVQPLTVTNVASSFFEDESLFPAGTARFDSALLMRGIPHEWHARAPIRITTDVASPPNHPIDTP